MWQCVICGTSNAPCELTCIQCNGLPSKVIDCKDMKRGAAPGLFPGSSKRQNTGADSLPLCPLSLVLPSSSPSQSILLYTVIPPVGEPILLALGLHATVRSATEIIGEQHGYSPFLQQLLVEGREEPLPANELLVDAVMLERSDDTTGDCKIRKIYLVMRSLRELDWSWERDNKPHVLWEMDQGSKSIQA